MAPTGILRYRDTRFMATFLPSRKELELITGGGAIPELSSWVGLHTWGRRGRHWPGVLELLDEAGGGEHARTCAWCTERPSPAENLSLPGHNRDSRRSPVLENMVQLHPGAGE